MPVTLSCCMCLTLETSPIRLFCHYRRSTPAALRSDPYESSRPLAFSCHLIDSRQRRVAARLIQTHDVLLRRPLPQQPQPLPKAASLLDHGLNFSPLGHPQSKAVITYSPLLSDRHPGASPHASVGSDSRSPRFAPCCLLTLLDRVALRIVPVPLGSPLPDQVILHLVELPRIEVQLVRRRIAAETLAGPDQTGVTAAQLAADLVIVLELATQLLQRAHRFSRRIVLVTPVGRVVGMLHIQRRMGVVGLFKGSYA